MISILISTKGEERQEYLTKCLKSIWDQKVSCEVLIAHDNSGKPNNNYNRLAAIAQGDYLLVLNDDCFLLPGFLRACEKTIASHPEMDLGLTYLGTPGDPHLIRYLWEIPFACFPLLKKGWKLFDELYPFYYVDQDLTFRVIHEGGHLVPIPGACLYHAAAPSERRNNPTHPDSELGWTILAKRWHAIQDDLRKKVKDQVFPATCDGTCRL